MNTHGIASDHRFNFRILVAALLVPACGTALAATSYHVTPQGSDAADGLSWATAKLTIQAAVDAAATGDEVVVSNGIYGVSAAVNIAKGVAVRSLAGPAATVIERSSGTTRLVSLAHADAVLEGFTITKSTFGGVQISSPGGTLANCIVTGNDISDTPRNGGGILMVGGRVQNCRVINNSVSFGSAGLTGRGGGIHASGGALIESTVISNNFLGRGTGIQSAGAGVHMTGSTLRNSLIAGNEHHIDSTDLTRSHAGGVYASSSTIENCTIADNYSRLTTGAGGLFNSGSAVINTIIYNNRDYRGINNYRNAGSAWSYQNCLATPLVAGDNNLAGDPCFRAPAMGDYRLRPGPAVDAGSYAAWMDGAFDLAGTVRVDGGAVDIGAYESPQGALDCYFSAEETAGVASLDAVFHAAADGTNTVGLFYNWSFTNGVADDISGPGRAVVTNTYAPGLYSVRLTVTNLAGEVATAVREDYIRVAPATIHVVPQGTPAYPYATWATAATNIHEAIATAPDGALILVSNGTYQVSRQVYINQGITLRSLNGAEVTTFSRSSGSFNVLYLGHPDAVVDGFTIRDSVWSGVEIDGGGSLLNSIIRDNLHNNNDPRVGGGVWIKDAGLIGNCRIINNRISYSGGYNGFGGGVYLQRGGLIDACIISNNIVGTGSGASFGGGVYMNGGTLRNSLVAGNTHNLQAGGVYAIGGAVVENCTIVDNYCPVITSTGGIYNDGLVRNSIVALNNNSGGLANYTAGTSGTCSYSCIDPAPAGTGNTALDPQFTDPVNRDYTIQPGPCVDSGLDQEWMDEAEDLAGNPRLVGDAVDMGAYEFVPGPLTCAFEGTPLVGLGSLDVAFTAAVGGANLDGLYYKWSFANSVSYDVEGYGRGVVTNTYPPGLYTVRLTVSNAADEVATAIREAYVRVAPPVAHVSTSGASVIPYDTWATAATNIHDAVAMSTDGGLILVSNGTYLVSSPIEIHEGLTLRGLNGPAATTIRRRGDSNSGLLHVTSSGAVIEGFTIREANRAPVVHLNTGGSISDCVIRDNITPFQDREGAGLRITGAATARNCIIINNHNQSTTTTGSSGGGVHMEGIGGLVEACIITNNLVGGGTGPGYGGGVYMTGDNTLRNCLVAFNTHDVYAAGVYSSGGTVESCTIVSNVNTRATRSTGATSTVGGILAEGATVRNSIIHGNLWQNELFNHDSTGTPSFQHCLTEPVAGLAGFGNIAGDPRCKDPSAGDFMILADSPALNAGTNQLWMAGAVDLGGGPRLRHKLVDIGAYEGRLPGGTMLLVR